MSEPLSEGDLGSDEDPVADAVRRASAAAASAPEEYRVKAFEMTLAHLLLRAETPRIAEEQTKNKVGRARRAPATNPADEQEIQPVLNAGNDLLTKYSYIPQISSASMKIYAVLHFAQSEFGLDGLTLAQIRSVLTTKFRVNIPAGTLTGQLSIAPSSELNRVKTGAKMKYSLMKAGEERLRAAIEAASEVSTAA